MEQDIYHPSGDGISKLPFSKTISCLDRHVPNVHMPNSLQSTCRKGTAEGLFGLPFSTGVKWPKETNSCH